MAFRFGPCELDPDQRRLTVGGEERHVEPQVFDLLRVLIDNRGRVVSKDELVESVWGGRIVSDAAISARIAAARSAVDDDGARQAVIRTAPRRGFRFVAEVEDSAPSAGPPAAPGSAAPTQQHIRFARSADGTSIAYAQTGAGPPLVRAGHWLTHLEHDWMGPIWRPFLDALGARFTLTRYDQRGNGLTDWAVEEFSLDRFVDDLEAVVDAAGLDRFSLYGTSQGAAIAVAYAVRRPERVARLILHGGYIRGRARRATAGEREMGEALLTLMRHGWGKPGSPFIQSFASMFMPGASEERLRAYVELQRLSATPENAIRIRTAVDLFDVTDLAPQVRAPTLVIHARHDGVQPLDQGRKLAAAIPGAEFMTLESENHVLLAEEPAFERLIAAIIDFAARD